MNENNAIRKIFGEKKLQISRKPIINHVGISNRIASSKSGIRKYRAVFPDSSEKCFIGKTKSSLIIANGIKLLSGGNPILFLMLVMNHKILGYNQSYAREAVIYNGFDDSLKKYLPDIIGSLISRFNGSCFIAMEELGCHSCDNADLYRMTDAICEFHAHYFGASDCIGRLGINCYSPADYRRSRGFIKRLFNRLSDENLVIFGKAKLDLICSFIDNMHNEFSAVEKRRTLTHNDYSVRNIYADEQRICIYDWELACYQNPEHDIIELLVSVMTDIDDDEVKKVLEYYREKLSELTKTTLTDEEYSHLLRFNTLEFCVNKLSILRIGGQYLKLDYTQQLAKNTSRMFDILKIC